VALRVAAAFFLTALGGFPLLEALTGAVAFEALLFLPVGFALTEAAFLGDAWTVLVFLLLFVAESPDLAPLFFVRCDIYVPL